MGVQTRKLYIAVSLILLIGAVFLLYRSQRSLVSSQEGSTYDKSDAKRPVPARSSPEHKPMWSPNEMMRPPAAGEDWEEVALDEGEAEGALPSPVSSLRSKVTVPARKKVVVLVAYYRSGSSFVGELFNQHPSVYYYFEPIFWLEQQQRESADAHMLRKLKLLEHLLQCKPDGDWHPQPEFLRSSAAVQNATGCTTPTFIGRPDEKFYEPCYSNVMALISRQLDLATLCTQRRHAVVKTIRLSVAAATAVIDHAAFDARIVHLVRDPRGMIASQSAALRKKTSSVEDVAKDFMERVPMCHTMERDLQAGEEIERLYPGNYLKVNYESVAADPEAQIRRIYDFVGIAADDAVRRWAVANTHARGADGTPMGRTSRMDSVQTSLAWREKLRLRGDGLVRLLEEECAGAIRAGGYDFMLAGGAGKQTGAQPHDVRIRMAGGQDQGFEADQSETAHPGYDPDGQDPRVTQVGLHSDYNQPAQHPNFVQPAFHSSREDINVIQPAYHPAVNQTANRGAGPNTNVIQPAYHPDRPDTRPSFNPPAGNNAIPGSKRPRNKAGEKGEARPARRIRKQGISKVEQLQLRRSQQQSV